MKHFQNSGIIQKNLKCGNKIRMNVIMTLKCLKHKKNSEFKIPENPLAKKIQNVSKSPNKIDKA